MIQEVLLRATTGGLIQGETKTPHFTGVLEPSASPSPSPSPSSSNTTATTATTGPTQNTSENQNIQLRCPRCDSSNTKFCYYNNYNLTQPRHFCKSCRRYWTKGGALRNVPIGGGCRKNNKTTIGAIPSFVKPCSGKFKTFVSSEIGKPPGLLTGFDHQGLSSANPVLWATPQSSHLLALLRSTQKPNPNPNQMLNSVKQEGFLNGSGTGAIAPGPDPLICQLGNSFWRHNSQNQSEQQRQQQNGNFTVGDVENVGSTNQMHQRLGLKSSSGNYYSDYSPPAAAVFVGNSAQASLSSNSSAILESAPVVVAGGDQLLGNYWNNTSLSWSDVSTTNGAYH